MASVEQNKKKEDLENYLKELGSVAVAFYGGVDSTFLLKVAHDTLGEKCMQKRTLRKNMENSKRGACSGNRRRF